MSALRSLLDWVRGLWGPQEDHAAPPVPYVYEYVTHRGLGCDYTLKPAPNPRQASGAMWHPRPPRPGDFLLVANNSLGTDTTRYRLTEVEWCANPTDMYFWTGELAPRTLKEKAEDHLRLGLLSKQEFQRMLRG